MRRRALALLLLLLVLCPAWAEALTFTEIGVERFLGSDGIIYTLGQAIEAGYAPPAPPPPTPPPPTPVVSGACVSPLGEVPGASLAAVGDSITALGWPELLAFWRPALTITNHAVGGATSAQMLATQLPAALASGAAVITIGPCCWNDAAGGVPTTTTTANVRAMIQQAQAAGRQVMLVEQTPGGQGVDLTPNRAAMLALAVETCVRYVTTWNALNNPDAPSSILGTLRDEGAHPNAEGLRRIAERVAHGAGW